MPDTISTNRRSPNKGLTPRDQDLRNGDFNYDIEMQNRYRPFTNHAEEKTPSVASIVLIKNQDATTVEDFNSEGFFDDLRAKLKTPVDSNDLVLEEESKYVIPILDDWISPDYLGVFKNFGLTEYLEGAQERLQILKTFGKEWVGFMHGEEPRIYKYTGVFLDYVNYPFYEEFMRAYNHYLRGSKCIENKMQMYLSYDYKIVRGYIISISTQKNSANGAPQGMVGFQFRVLVQKEDFVRTKDLTNYKRRSYGIQNKQGTFINSDAPEAQSEDNPGLITIEASL